MYFLPIFFAFVCIFFPRCLFLALLLMALIAGLRKDVLGYDYSQYLAYYENYSSLGNYLSYEYGFSFLVDWFVKFGISFEVFIFFISLFFHYSLYIALRRLKDLFELNPGLLLVLFVASGSYYWLAYVITRQSLSTGVFYLLLAGIFIKNKNITSFVSSLGGAFFHISNIIILPIAFIRNKIVFFALLFAPLILIFFNYAISGSKYEGYLSSKSVGVFYLVEASFMLFLSMYLKRKNNNAINDFSFKLCVVFFVFYLFAFAFGVSTTRLLTGLYLLYYMPLVALIGGVEKSTRIALIIAVFVVAFVRIHLFISGFGDLGYPYVSIFG